MQACHLTLMSMQAGHDAGMHQAYLDIMQAYCRHMHVLSSIHATKDFPASLYSV